MIPVGTKVISSLSGFDRDAMTVISFDENTRRYGLKDGVRVYHLPEHSIKLYEPSYVSDDEYIQKRLNDARIKREQQNKQPVQIQERERYNAFEQTRLF